MGGYLIPRIYAADKEQLIAGYISLAGAARPMTELILEQYDYFLSLDIYNALEKAVLRSQQNQLKTGIEAILKLTEADRGKNTVPLSVYPVYPAYWLYLADYDPAEEIKKIDKPLLILQGGTDYQVTETDFNLFKKALDGRDNAEFILYPNLSHAFTYTEQMSTPADYMSEATVDKQVARDIADFIKNN
jgi:fermentation-respiration switch protein FrsA (DUF1100 family)